jgi:hypothetical protein
MRMGVAALALILNSCGSLPWAPDSEVSEAACKASCDAHLERCPQVFAGFPERGAVECQAEHDRCLKSCAAVQPRVHARSAPPANEAATSKEAKLRELKHLYDEGLVSDDVYRARQAAILAEP